ncbi:MAG: hypothetical protein K2N88_06390 [Muribaculaceae bacterium]|nr:hypothetical protein [Muribaculaceae bacterium]
MKQRNSTGKKAVVITTVASLLGSSCSGYLEPPLHEESPKTNKVDQNTGTRSLPIYEGLTEDEYAFMDAIIRLIEDMINENIDPNILKNDSKHVLESYGYAGEIIIDDDLLRILSAFGKVEFTEAIRNQDIDSFIKVAKEEGLLRYDIDQRTKDIDFENLPEPTKQLITNIRKSREINNKDVFTQQAISDWFIDSVAVAAVIAIAGIEVAIVVMVVVLGAAKSDRISSVENFSTQVAFNKLMNARKVDVWDAYTQYNGTVGLYNFMDKQITELCDVTLKVVDELYPEYWDIHSKAEIRNSIGILFMNYLFESEK